MPGKTSSKPKPQKDADVRPTHVALLRGINVGGKNKLPMKDLAEMFVDAGCTAVSTYIQSGNVVFHADEKHAAKLPTVISNDIQKRLQINVPVVVRSAKELWDISEHNPYLDTGTEFSKLFVMFLSDEPGAESIQALDPDRSPPDEFVVRGREIYLHCSNGAADTKLTNAWFDSKLRCVSTSRNWNTVLKLCELLGLR